MKKFGVKLIPLGYFWLQIEHWKILFQAHSFYL